VDFGACGEKRLKGGGSETQQEKKVDFHVGFALQIEGMSGKQGQNKNIFYDPTESLCEEMLPEWEWNRARNGIKGVMSGRNYACEGRSFGGC
jgi:hypothetical protein